MCVVKECNRLIILALLLVGNNVFSQVVKPCVDSLRGQELYQCNREQYEPVCGCNGETYRNQCEAYNNFGVNRWTNGVCAGLFIDVYPNPSFNQDYFNVGIQLQGTTQGNITVYLFDLKGQLKRQMFFNNKNRVDFTFPVFGLDMGMYVMWVRSGNYSHFVKLIRS